MKVYATVNGDPVPAITWYHDGSVISGRGNVMTDLEGNLTNLIIRRVNQRDEGDYKITAKNEWGSVSSTINVSIRGKQWFIIVVYI